VSFIGCDVIRFAGVSGTQRQFDVRDVVFESHGTPGRQARDTAWRGKVAVVVLLRDRNMTRLLKTILCRGCCRAGIAPRL
jgi:S-adenosylmethionine:diacylglycerol 3-amino-3-carboxypropyl transferase